MERKPKIAWRAVKEEDIEVIKKWLNDPETLKLARMQENVQITSDDIRLDFLNKIEKRRVQMITSDDVPVGYFKVWTYDRGSEIGLVIGDPSFRNKGIGTFVLNRLIQILEPPLFWVTFSGNEGSISLALKCGFALLYPDIDAIELGGEKFDKYVFVGGKDEKESV